MTDLWPANKRTFQGDQIEIQISSDFVMVMEKKDKIILFILLGLLRRQNILHCELVKYEKYLKN